MSQIENKKAVNLAQVVLTNIQKLNDQESRDLAARLIKEVVGATVDSGKVLAGAQKTLDLLTEAIKRVSAAEEEKEMARVKAKLEKRRATMKARLDAPVEDSGATRRKRPLHP